MTKPNTTFNDADHYLARSGLDASWERNHPSSPIHLAVHDPEIIEELEGKGNLHAWGWDTFISAIDVLVEWKEEQASLDDYEANQSFYNVEE